MSSEAERSELLTKPPLIWGNKWGNMPHRLQPIPAGSRSREIRLKLCST